MNIGCGGSVSIKALAETMIALSGAQVQIRYGPARSGDIRHSQADISRARELLGYEVVVTPEEGLRGTLAWYQEMGQGSRG